MGKEKNMSDTQSKVSPIVAIAAGSVIVFSAVGVGVMTGLIPSSFSNVEQRADATKSTAAAAPAAIPPVAATVTPTTPPAKAAAPAPRVAAPAPKAAPSPAPLPASTAGAEQAPPMAGAEQAPSRAERRRTAARACATCGTVKAVNVVERAGEGSGLGAIGGAVVGGLLGNQIGDGSGRRIATVAGAAGGAYGGHQVEKHVKSSKSWSVVVRMQDGESRTFPFASDPGFHAGDRVRVVDGRLVHRKQGG
jgi:outer membrane lipoprotein SlyB